MPHQVWFILAYFWELDFGRSVTQMFLKLYIIRNSLETTKPF